MAETTTIARPYAQAIFNLAQDRDALKKWSEMLVLAASVAGDPEMAALIDNPRLTRDQIVDLFLDICGDRLNEEGRNMIRVLADNGRLELLPEIAVLYEVERAGAEGTLTAEVTSARRLSSAQQKAMAGALQKRFGREIKLQCTVDKSLKGGAIIRAGDVVIDGSAVGRLEKLSHRLLR